MSAIELQNLTLTVKTRNGDVELDVVEVCYFLQEVIDGYGEKSKEVKSYEIVPVFQKWAAERKNHAFDYGEAWEVMKVCQAKFEEAKKKFAS